MKQNSQTLTIISRQNELVAERFLYKVHDHTKNTQDVAIKWVARKVKNFVFSVGQKPVPSYVINEGIFNCGENYIGETVINVSFRWKEHKDP